MNLALRKVNFISMIKTLYNGDQKIEAIKLWRFAFKTSLVEAKEAIEYLVANM
jgi:ribosomal protein L7/L12